MSAWATPTVVGRNLRLVHVDQDGALAARGAALFRLAAGAERWERIHAREDTFAPLLERSLAWRRLVRADVVSACRASDGALLCVARKRVLRAAGAGSALSPVFRITRGSRPLAVASTGAVAYFGEYFANPRREPVSVFGSRDGGRTWRAEYEFPAGSIRHVHRVLFDPERSRVWILTGDEDHECKVLYTDDDFATVHVAAEGSQSARAVSAVPIPGGLLFATDDPNGRNHVRILGDDGRIEDVAELEGPSFFATRARGLVLVSTAVEPSRVNVTGRSTVVAARVTDLRDWRTIWTAPKDGWPMKLFQYGNVVLPDGPGDGRHAWASGVALRGFDGVVWRWDAEALERGFDGRG